MQEQLNLTPENRIKIMEILEGHVSIRSDKLAPI